MNTLVQKAKTIGRRWQNEGRYPRLTRTAALLWHQGKNLRDYVQLPRAVERAREPAFPRDPKGAVSETMGEEMRAVRPIQDVVEITCLVERVAALRPKRVLEIGTARGGSLLLWCCFADPEAEIVSIDLPFGRNGGGYPLWKAPHYRRFARQGQRIELMRCNSHDPTTHAALRRLSQGKPFDFIFIDGDHSYEGVKADFHDYVTMLAPSGLLALHDVTENEYDPSIDVHRLWQEIEVDPRYKTETFISRPGKGFGIGLVRFA